MLIRSKVEVKSKTTSKLDVSLILPEPSRRSIHQSKLPCSVDFDPFGATLNVKLVGGI